MDVRHATLDDLDDLLRLQLQLRDHHRRLAADSPRYGVQADRWRRLLRATLESDDEAILVATNNDDVRGFVTLVFAPKPWGVSCEMDTLVVDEASRSEGVGEALVAAAEILAKERGAGGMRANVLTANDRGRAFYERIGYEPIAVRYSKDF
ncbi:MAG: GNAT family N-acetyltransferase [Actinomycetota bacterium]